MRKPKPQNKKSPQATVKKQPQNVNTGPQNPHKRKKYVSPYPSAYRFKKDPEALERRETTRSQQRYDEHTLIWGENDNFPLKLAQAVEKSPAATSCNGTVSQFIKGSGFTNKDAQKLKLNKKGLTMWSLHCQLSDMLALFDGFSVRFTYNKLRQITNVYVMPFECLRFKKPEDDLQTDFTEVVYNPFFGTDEYERKFSKPYPLFDPEKLESQISAMGKAFPGQVYYYGKTKPLHPYYPEPDYWSAEGWIKVDAKIQGAHNENLDNGFFQSCMMTVVGNPNEMTDNPRYMRTYVDEATGDTITESTKTRGEEFSEQMSANFSGSEKMGNVFVRWVVNKDDAIEISPFPNSTNADLFIALQDLTTKNITIARKVPGILANISEGVNLGSTGNEMQKAIEIMQSNTSEYRMTLEEFYNGILLPALDPSLNLQTGVPPEGIKIVNYNPITVPIEIEDKVWEQLTSEEKRRFIKKNFPDIELIEVAPTLNAAGNTIQSNDTFKNLTGRQLQGILRVVKKFNNGDITEQQARQLLMAGYDMTTEQADEWLITQQEDAVNTPTIPQ